MKGGKAHRVPLTDRALEILAEVAILRPKDDDGSALVFPSTKPGKPLSDMTLTAVMRRLGAGAYTVHGFRSSFRDWAGDVTSFPREVAEAALAHVVQGVEGAYRRSDAFEKRRQLMTAWANFLHVDPAGNVVVLRR
jgi:integrase